MLIGSCGNPVVSGGSTGGRDGGGGAAIDDAGRLVGGITLKLDASLLETDAATVPSIPQNIATMRIEPIGGVLEVQRGKASSTKFRVWARMQGADSTEVDITERSVFYVPDNYLVGTFPADGASTFSVRVPSAASDPPQRGGVVTIQAQAANSVGPATTVTTTYTVKLIDEVVPIAGAGTAKPALPADPAAVFVGTDAPALAPQLIYPNDGVLLPPNLGQLEIHWLPGTTPASLYEVSFESSIADFRHYVRCHADPTRFVAGTCVLEFDKVLYEELAQTHRGVGPVQVRVRGSNEAGKVGSSKTVSVEFAKDRVDGAVYYWSASPPPSIMRFDFGSQGGLAPVLKPNDLPGDDNAPKSNGTCVGCHLLSRDGRRMVVSKGDSSVSLLVYLKDLAAPRTAGSSWLTVDGRNAPPASENRFLVGAFDPTGDTFVAVSPPRDTTSKTSELIFHDAATGLRKTGPGSRLDLGFNVTYPDWSPDGNLLAVTRIRGDVGERVQFTKAGISLVANSPAGFVLPAIDIVPVVAGKSRYNAVFTPDSSFLLYSETILAPGESPGAANGYSNPAAKSWAVAPKAGATPVFLAKASAPSVADTMTVQDNDDSRPTDELAAGNLMDTFPRPTPFSSVHNGHKLFWFTVSSQRRPGLRKYFPNSGAGSLQTLLWMFALDADQLAAGKDGSYPGFFLPFQDMTTSNHMASWTQKYVSDNPPPPPPAEPPPPVAPPPPPIL